MSLTRILGPSREGAQVIELQMIIKKMPELRERIPFGEVNPLRRDAR